MTVALMKTTVETLTQVIGTTDFELLVKTVAVVMHRHIAMQSHAQVRTINPYINECYNLLYIVLWKIIAYIC